MFTKLLTLAASTLALSASAATVCGTLSWGSGDQLQLTFISQQGISLRYALWGASHQQHMNLISQVGSRVCVNGNVTSAAGAGVTGSFQVN